MASPQVGLTLTFLAQRLNDRGKLWRHVWKALLVVEFIVIKGSKAAVRYFTQNLYVVKTLREFQYIDEAGMDQGKATRNPCCTLPLTFLPLNRSEHSASGSGARRPTQQ